MPSQALFELDTSTTPGYRSFSGRTLYCVLRPADGSQLEGTRIKEQPS